MIADELMLRFDTLILQIINNLLINDIMVIILSVRMIESSKICSVAIFLSSTRVNSAISSFRWVMKSNLCHHELVIFSCHMRLKQSYHESCCSTCWRFCRSCIRISHTFQLRLYCWPWQISRRRRHCAPQRLFISGSWAILPVLVFDTLDRQLQQSHVHAIISYPSFPRPYPLLFK